MDSSTLAEMTGPRSVQAENTGAKPVFLLGIMHRSGTNFLAQLLEQHPLIARGPVPEDFLVAKLSALELYLRRVTGEWNPRWPVGDRASDLRRALGSGISVFATVGASGGEEYALARTPSVLGLDLVRQFLPDAHIIILLRDGRAIVESGRRSFGWNFDEAARHWDASARTIKSFIAGDSHPEHTVLVRYEHLVSRPQEEVEKLLGFLGLDSAELPAEALASVPVIGSSELKATGSEDIHWQPVDIENFRPLERFASWTRSEHQRFDWLAGEMLKEFSYSENRIDHGLKGAAWQNLKSLVGACRPTNLRHSLRRLIRGAPPG